MTPIPTRSRAVSHWIAAVLAKPRNRVGVIHTAPNGTEWTVTQGREGYTASSNVLAVTGSTYEEATGRVDDLMGGV